MKNVGLILDPAACGADRAFKATCLANALARRDDPELTTFLMGDAVTCAFAGGKTPDGYDTSPLMLKGRNRARHAPRLRRPGPHLLTHIRSLATVASPRPENTSQR